SPRLRRLGDERRAAGWGAGIAHRGTLGSERARGVGRCAGYRHPSARPSRKGLPCHRLGSLHRCCHPGATRIGSAALAARWAGRRYHLRQVWTWRGPRYDLSFEITPVDGAEAGGTVLKTSYLAIPVAQVTGLMRAVGFENVERVDGRFFQPVLVGTRPVV